MYCNCWPSKWLKYLLWLSLRRMNAGKDKFFCLIDAGKLTFVMLNIFPFLHPTLGAPWLICLWWYKKWCMFFSCSASTQFFLFSFSDFKWLRLSKVVHLLPYLNDLWFRNAAASLPFFFFITAFDWWVREFVTYHTKSSFTSQKTGFESKSSQWYPLQFSLSCYDKEATMVVENISLPPLFDATSRDMDV